MTPRRNPEMTEQAKDPYLDGWSPIHLAVGVALGTLIPPFWALLMLALWEPFVLLILSPRLKGAKGFVARTQLAGPTLRNVLMDLVFDVIGVAIGAYLLKDALGW